MQTEAKGRCKKCCDVVTSLFPEGPQSLKTDLANAVQNHVATMGFELTDDVRDDDWSLRDAAIKRIVSDLKMAYVQLTGDFKG